MSGLKLINHALIVENILIHLICLLLIKFINKFNFMLFYFYEYFPTLHIVDMRDFKSHTKDYSQAAAQTCN